MTLYVDSPRWPAHGREFAHLISDESYAELHRFAAAAGLHPRGFDGDHYDVPRELHAAVVAAGALLVDGGDLARRLNASGLRFRKRKGERPLARLHGAMPGLDQPHTLDLLGSAQEPPVATTAAAGVFVVDPADRLLLVHHLGRGGWEAPAGAREGEEPPRHTAVREAHEETGTVLDPGALVPVGYERLTLSEPTRRWPHTPDNHIAFYLVRIPSTTRPTPLLEEVSEVRWVPRVEVPALCGGAFWWPLLEHVLAGW